MKQIHFTAPVKGPTVLGWVVTTLLAKKAAAREGKPFDVEVERAASARLATKLPRTKGVTTTEERIAGIRVVRSSSGNADRGTVLAFHGGAYVLGVPETISIPVAKRGGPDVVSVDYRLAPEHAYPAAQDDALAVYRALLDTVGADKLVVMGDSAGGGLALTLLQGAAAEGLPMPAALVAMFPWGDLSLSGDSWTANQGRDVLVHSEIDQAAHSYAGDLDRNDPRVSPLFGSFAGFPPTYMAVGDRDLILDDVRGIEAKMQEAGVQVHLDVFPGAPHGFNAVPFAQGRQCNARARALIDHALPRTDH